MGERVLDPTINSSIPRFYTLARIGEQLADIKGKGEPIYFGHLLKNYSNLAQVIVDRPGGWRKTVTLLGYNPDLEKYKPSRRKSG